MARSNQIRVASLFLDLAAIFVALACSGIWAEDHPGSLPARLGLIAAHVAWFGIVWTLVANRLGTYLVPLPRNRRQAVRAALETWGITWGVAGLVAQSSVGLQGIDLWLALVFGAVTLTVARVLAAHTALAEGSGRPRTLVIGAGSSARTLSSGRDATAAMELVGYVPFTGEQPDSMPHLPRCGSIAQLAEIVQEQRADLALVCPSDAAVTGEVHRVFDTCDLLGLNIQFFPSFLDLRYLHVGMTWNADHPGLTLRTHQNHSTSLFAKRAIDVVGATIGLTLLLPVFLGCALAVKLTSKGPVFFRQTRVGKNGTEFTCLKFRTMRVGAHSEQELLRAASTQDGPAFKIPQDPRITPAGRILRKFSVDELPQLLNVLIGDMSIVGPRPPIPSEVAKYAWWQRRRISVKPGLTCVWQVWGRNRVSFKRWVEMDLYYIDNWSLWLDLKLIAHTFRVVLRGTGM